MTAIEPPAVARPLRVSMLGIRGFPNVQGGAENHAEHLAAELVELGCEVEALAAALDRFGTLPDARLAAMGAAGRRWVEEDFTAARYRNRLLALYASLDDANQRPEHLQ